MTYIEEQLQSLLTQAGIGELGEIYVDIFDVPYTSDNQDPIDTLDFDDLEAASLFIIDGDVTFNMVLIRAHNLEETKEIQFHYNGENWVSDVYND